MSNETENPYADIEKAQPETTVTDPKKKPQKGKKIGIIVAVAVALVLVILNGSKIANAAVKLFTSPEGYFQYVLSKSTDDVAELIGENYGNAMDRWDEKDNLRSEATLSVTFGDEVLEWLEEETGTEFDWMEKLSLLMNTDSKKDAYKIDMGLDVSEERLISFVMLANMADKMAYFQIPELNETYLGVDLEDAFEEMDLEEDELDELIQLYDEIAKAMPKDDKLEKMLKHYFDLAISCVDDVEQTNGKKVTVDGITNKYTVLEATIDEGTIAAMLEVVIDELKEDKDVEKMIYDVSAVICDLPELQDEIDADEVYDEFLELLEELEEEIDEIEDEDFEFVLSLYVDNEGKIKGWALEVEDEDVEISSLLVTKGSKFAYELEGNIDGLKAVFEGKGKLGLSKISGDFRLEMLGMDILEISVKDLKTKDLMDGYFNGTVSVFLEKDASKMIEDEMGDELPFDVEDFELEFIGKNSKDTWDNTVSLYEKDDLLVSVSFVNKIGKAKSIKYPKDKEVAMAEDEEDVKDWLLDLEIDDFVDDLEDIFGEDFVEFLEDVLSGEIEIPGFGGHKEVYDYDDYYYDEWY